jgi:hypothetical protein
MYGIIAGLQVFTSQSMVVTCVPSKTVTLGPKDPAFVTPLIKNLLNKRNRMRRTGNVDAADKLAEKINCLIADFRSKQFIKMKNANSKQLWAAVKGKSSLGCDSSNYNNILSSPDLVNQFYATVATASDYNLAEIINMREILALDDYDAVSTISFNELDIEPLLRRMKNTAPGYDNVPCWVFKSCSYELAGIVASIITQSLRTGTVPVTWLTAIVTPVPKVPIPKCIADFRPISVTPLLSRLTERLLVRDWFGPALAKIDLQDQYAFKPTGSTNCALIDCFDFVTSMLECNNYVRCLLIDFSKAFDVVDHAVIIRKLKVLDLSASLKNWIISFLTGRSQITKIFGCFSGALEINRGIVQGSGIGPSLYILLESDLHPISANNHMFKFADDTNLLVPEHTDVTLQDEFANVIEWARRNKMVINFSKTKEIVFRRPHPSKFSILPTFSDIEMVRQVKLLGVLISDTLSFESYVNALLSSCSQRFYLLKTLRDGGMPIRQLNVVYSALIIGRIFYCLSAWGGFLNSEQAGRINALLKRAVKYRFTDTIYDFDGMLLHADCKLFKNIQCENHSLNHCLPASSTNDICQRLRKRRHNYVLPLCHYQLYRSSFFARCLYAFL